MKESRYNDIVPHYTWLKRFKNTSQRGYIESADTQYKIRITNKISNTDYNNISKIRSGRDIVSRFTYHDLRQYIPFELYQLVHTLFNDERDCMTMMRWLIRGLEVYPAFCKTIEMNPYADLVIT